MKKMILISTTFLILIVSCNQTDNNLDKFYGYLGQEQSVVLKETVDYFNQFLADNFKDERSKEDKIYKFLKYFDDHETSPNDDWIYDLEKCKSLIEKFETSGLRKEIWVYGWEIPKDTIMPKIDAPEHYKQDTIGDYKKIWVTEYGRIVKGLEHYPTADTSINNYVEIMTLIGDLAPTVLIKGLLKFDKKSYLDPYFDIIMIKELFYGLMEYNCK